MKNMDCICTVEHPMQLGDLVRYLNGVENLSPVTIILTGEASTLKDGVRDMLEAELTPALVSLRFSVNEAEVNNDERMTFLMNRHFPSTLFERAKITIVDCYGMENQSKAMHARVARHLRNISGAASLICISVCSRPSAKADASNRAKVIPASSPRRVLADPGCYDAFLKVR